MIPLLFALIASFFNANLAVESDQPGLSTSVELFSLPYTPTQRRFSLSIEEESRLGDAIFRVVPAPESGISSFSRIDIAPNCSGAAYFMVTNASSGEIRLARLLDFEFAQTLDLDVRAWLAPPAPGASISTAASMAPMAHALVGVQVVNINDHQPVFDSPKDPLTGELYAQVSENAPPGTLVAQLHASDVDLGEVGEMRYLIVGVAPGTPAGFADAFGVDPVEGSVRVINSTLLDREATREVDLLVAAYDNPNRFNRQYAAIARLTIALIDQNDNAPKFNATSFGAADVCECSKTGSVVAQIAAQDLDESSQNQLSYRLVDANVTFAPYVPQQFLARDPRTLFSVDRNTGQVTVSAETLASLIGNYTLLIEVADQGGLTARTLLHFNVSSDNKFAPEFTNPVGSWTDGASLAENMPPDTRVFQVNAVDKDTFGTNGVIEYYFYDNETNVLVSQLAGFKINKATGVIQSARSFDAETDPAIVTLAVVARDRGTPQLQANNTLFVRILDQDEFPPKWQVTLADGCNIQFNFWIPERSPIGGRIGRVWSEDADRTNRSYFRLEPRNDAKYFSVNPTTGVITIANPDASNAGTTTPGQEVTATFLDYEDKERRDFVIFVTVSPLAAIGSDSVGAPSPTTASPSAGGVPAGCMRGNVARVHVHLTNMEDVKPAFGRGNKPYYFCVAGNAVKNTLISYLPPVTATDLDGSKLTFRMSSTEWRSSAGFVSVTCAMRVVQGGTTQSANQPPEAKLVVNSAIGNYSRSYFRVPLDVRDQAGQSSTSAAYVWVTPAEDESPVGSNDLTIHSSTSSDEIIQPTPPSDKSTYYATLTVAKDYDSFVSEINAWVDCVSEQLLASDRWLAGAPICIASARPHPSNPRDMTEVRIAAASKSDMLLVPAVLLVGSIQQNINSTVTSTCGVIGATCFGCGTGITAPITGEYAAREGGFNPLALLIALAVILLFLILLLLILLAICCRARRKAPILVPAPPAPPAVPVFAVKPARLYETQEAYMAVDQEQFRERQFEEQEIVLDEGQETEEVFEIPLPREYETQTVLMEMPTWAARDFGHDNPTLILDHGAAGEPQQIPLTHQHGARHLSGSVYSEPYFRSATSEQRAFSMLHIDTRPQPQPVLQQPITRNPQPSNQPRRHHPSSTADLSPGASKPIMHTVVPAASQPTPRGSVAGGRTSRTGNATPIASNLPGGISHISRRLGDIPPSPQSQVSQGYGPSSQPPQHHHHPHNHQPQVPQQLPQRQSPRPAPGGLLRPAISADSITLLSQQQQARRAALHNHQQQHEQPEMRYSGRTDESEPSEAEDALRRHQLEDEDMRGGGNGRLRRTRSLPKYLQPPAELQSVMAELHDYIKSPEQKARRRRISQKYRAKLLASGGGAALVGGNQATGQTSSSTSSLDQTDGQSTSTSQQQSSYSNNNNNRSSQQQQHGGNNGRGRDYMML